MPGVAKFAPIAETSEGAYDEMFDINIKGAYFTIQKGLPFLKNERASIILNCSVAASKGTEGASAYAATKAHCVLWRETTAAELVGRGIRVNTVAPGPSDAGFGKTGLQGSHRRILEGNTQTGSHEAVWSARRSGRNRGILGFARRFVHYRSRNQRGWWLRTNLNCFRKRRTLGADKNPPRLSKKFLTHPRSYRSMPINSQ